MTPVVSVVIPFVQDDVQSLSLAVKSVLDQLGPDKLEVVVLNCSAADNDSIIQLDPDQAKLVTVVNGPKERDNVFSRVLEAWFLSTAKYVCWLSPSNRMGPERLSKQVGLMEIKGLSACYGDVLFFNKDSSKPERLLETREFQTSMIGLDSYSAETLLINRQKFMEAGGFDHILAACYKPKPYIMTMVAIAGRVERCPVVAVHDRQCPDIFPSPKNITDELTPSSKKDLWMRIRFETFLVRARRFAEQNWKN